MTLAGAIPIRLDNPHRHAGTIRSTTPLTVESPPEQWAYAISLPLPPEAPRALRAPLKVSASVVVESGELGCLIVAHDWRTVLGGMTPPARAGHHTLELFLEQEPDGAHLVFRNSGAGNTPCVFTVESVSIAPDQGDRLKWSLDLTDILEGTPPRINMPRLHDAAVNRDRGLADDVEVFDRLRRKWNTVPAGLSDRKSTAELLSLSDGELREFWTATHHQAATGPGFAVRGWYQTLYRDVLWGKKVLEIGSGMGLDGIEFARHGARLTFVDIVEDNLRVMRRLCDSFGIQDAQFVYLRGFASLDALPFDYDVVWNQGSQINAPFDFARRECAVILPHLKPGGRWIELAYPRERWERDGQPPFRLWGNMTDGEGTPWMEWYDLDRLLARLAPERFAPVLAFNFHDDDFNWFDLLKLDDRPQVR
jgi:SAM-dependent methyltransferase